ncbi:hypothetical protein Tco_0457796 [Tanacetum coccineum]
MWATVTVIHVAPIQVEFGQERMTLSHNSNRSFLGLEVILPEIYEISSKIASLLHLLSQKNKDYVWGDKQDEAFQILRRNYANAPVVGTPDAREFVVLFVMHQNKTKIFERRAKLFKDSQSPDEWLRGLGKPLFSHTSRYSVHPGADKMYYDLTRIIISGPGMKRTLLSMFSRFLRALRLADISNHSGFLQQPEMPRVWTLEDKLRALLGFGAVGILIIH